MFRIRTAAALLIGLVYGWIYAPERLTEWKHATENAVQFLCSQLPYPWGDRIEATVGDFGVWVQITLAIVAFHIAAWLVIDRRRLKTLTLSDHLFALIIAVLADPSTLQNANAVSASEVERATAAVVH